MKYNFHSGDLFNELLKINNIDKQALEISRYDNVIKDEKSILSFKDKLLSLKDDIFLIVGDYDCDGICATAILKRLLEYLNIKHKFYIPSRIKEGYGLNKQIVQNAINNHINVIITVDNGIKATEALKYAYDNNVKVLIIDHHNYEEEPLCFSYIHPILLKEGFNNLSAGGLSYLLSTYFYDDKLSLCYAGLTTLSDMVGVLDYNRYLIKKMYETLCNNDIYQINLLNDNKQPTYDDLSFNVIPKINSISRMGYNANTLVKYLCGDKETCLHYLDSINKINDERKNETNLESYDAYSLVNEDDNLIIVASTSFKEGLCGLLANKLAFKYKKTCIVFSISEDLYKGSGRSLEDVDLFNYLSKETELYENFGGHNQACGIVIKKDNFDEFKRRILNNKLESKEIVKDVISLNQSEVNYDLLTLINSLKPFGVDFKEPLFHVKDFKYQRKFIIKEMYPKYIVDNTLSAISFKEIDDNFHDLICKIQNDNYHKQAVSLLIEDTL